MLIWAITRRSTGKEFKLNNLAFLAIYTDAGFWSASRIFIDYQVKFVKLWQQRLGSKLCQFDLWIINLLLVAAHLCHSLVLMWFMFAGFLHRHRKLKCKEEEEEHINLDCLAVLSCKDYFLFCSYRRIWCPRRYCASREGLNTFTVTGRAETFGLIIQQSDEGSLCQCGTTNL